MFRSPSPFCKLVPQISCQTVPQLGPTGHPIRTPSYNPPRENSFLPHVRLLGICQSLEKQSPGPSISSASLAFPYRIYPGMPIRSTSSSTFIYDICRSTTVRRRELRTRIILSHSACHPPGGLGLEKAGLPAPTLCPRICSPWICISSNIPSRWIGFCHLSSFLRSRPYTSDGMAIFGLTSREWEHNLSAIFSALGPSMETLDLSFSHCNPTRVSALFTGVASLLHRIRDCTALSHRCCPRSIPWA